MRASSPHINLKKPVRVFRNWRHHCYSVMQNGVVYASAREVVMADVRFLVRDSGRQRMLCRGVKNVHAYAIGTLLDVIPVGADTDLIPRLGGREVFYDALRFASFVDRESLVPVHEAALAHLHLAGVTYRELPTAIAA